MDLKQFLQSDGSLLIPKEVVPLVHIKKIKKETINYEIKKAKGNIPYWIIAYQLGVHENTIRNWLKSELSEDKKMALLAAINKIREESIEKYADNTVEYIAITENSRRVSNV